MRTKLVYCRCSASMMNTSRTTSRLPEQQRSFHSGSRRCRHPAYWTASRLLQIALCCGGKRHRRCRDNRSRAVSSCRSLIGRSCCRTQPTANHQSSLFSLPRADDNLIRYIIAIASYKLTLWRPLLPYVKSSFVIFDIRALWRSPWASECPGVKNYKWRLNPVWHRMLYSCTHMATVGVKGLISYRGCSQGLEPQGYGQELDPQGQALGPRTTILSLRASKDQEQHLCLI